MALTLSNAEILEIPGADHALEVPDVAKSLDHLKRVTEAVTRFASGSHAVGRRLDLPRANIRPLPFADDDCRDKHGDEKPTENAE